MSRTKKTIEKNDRTISREMIKKCAEALFIEKGVENTSVNDIVRTAEIAKGTFYIYFKNKDDLINAVFEKYGDDFFNNVVMKNKDLPKITFFADSILDYFSGSKLFLIELRKNMGIHKDFPYYKRTMTAFSKVILNFLNFHEDYPIKQVVSYSEILIGTILEICYRLIIEETITDRAEAKIMLEDFMKRFFNCENGFFY